MANSDGNLTANDLNTAQALINQLSQDNDALLQRFDDADHERVKWKELLIGLVIR